MLTSAGHGGARTGGAESRNVDRPGRRFVLIRQRMKERPHAGGKTWFEQGATGFKRSAMRGKLLGHRGAASFGHRRLQPLCAAPAVAGTVGEMRVEHARLAIVWPGRHSARRPNFARKSPPTQLASLKSGCGLTGKLVAKTSLMRRTSPSGRSGITEQKRRDRSAV